MKNAIGLRRVLHVSGDIAESKNGKGTEIIFCFHPENIFLQQPIASGKYMNRVRGHSFETCGGCPPMDRSWFPRKFTLLPYGSTVPCRNSAGDH